MPEPPVVNASPIIGFARAGLLDLLQIAGPRIIVPTPVAEEVARGSRGEEVEKGLADQPWLEVADPPPTPSTILAWDLDPGETAVLAWAYTHPGSLAILDDRAARRCASALSIEVCGSVGLVLIARKRDVIPAARPVLERMRQGGFYLSDRIIDQAVFLVGE